MYKLTIYQYHHRQAFPVHIYYSDSREHLENKFKYHKKQNSEYKGLLIRYRAETAEVLSD